LRYQCAGARASGSRRSTRRDEPCRQLVFLAVGAGEGEQLVHGPVAELLLLVNEGEWPFQGWIQRHRNQTTELKLFENGGARGDGDSHPGLDRTLDGLGAAELDAHLQLRAVHTAVTHILGDDLAG